MFENQKTKIMKQENNTTEMKNKRHKLIEERVYAEYCKRDGGFGSACDEANKYPEVTYEYCEGCDCDAPTITGLHECLVCGSETKLPTPNNTTQDRELFTGLQKWEVHKQRKSGIGNTGYGYAVLMPLITKEGEYKGQRGGYHVIVHQDFKLSKEDAENICKVHNEELSNITKGDHYELGYREGYHAALNEVDKPSEFLPADEKLNTDFVTPGNWATDGLAVIVPGTFPEIEICVCTEDDEIPRSQAEANALLISEAKNLLDIAQRVVFIFGNENNYPEGTMGYRIWKDANEILTRITNKK